MDFVVKNYDIDEILTGGSLKALLDIVKELWPRGLDVYIAEIQPLHVVEGRKPASVLGKDG